MYETQKTERALLVIVEVEGERQIWSSQELAEELKNLVISTGIDVGGLIFVKRKEINPSLYIGKGKALELAKIVQQESVNVIIFNNNLSFTQQRNLEEIVGVKTIDRTQLILDIFARHAHTQEGALQVELAQLEYLLPRLKGKGIMLSRLGGGIGTRGPGEKKLEVDKRRISDRITKLKKDLDHLKRHRQLLRKKREKEKIPICSLVGYTNAGKTTLLNALTGEHQKTSSYLFTTLDPISRTLHLEGNLKAIVTDTVGFLYKLPPNLIEAFKATLEELHYAHLLLHIVDGSNKNYTKLIDAVNTILKDLSLLDKNIILVFNKIDKLTEEELEILKGKFPEAVFISALKKLNLDSLLRRIEKVLFGETIEVSLNISLKSLDLLNWIYEHAQVINTQYYQDRVVVAVRIKEGFLPFLNNGKVFLKKHNNFNRKQKFF
ncbi:MAG: GTPase HflX [Candidatus Omnitrophica bacterium]|nr:GTPase HflX [Candidatus Omnitrophota bacterium]